MTDEEKDSLESDLDAISQVQRISILISYNEEEEETNDKEKKKRGRPPLNKPPKQKSLRKEDAHSNKKQNQKNLKSLKDAPEAENPNHPHKTLQDDLGLDQQDIGDSLRIQIISQNTIEI